MAETAAWIRTAGARLEVGPAPEPVPGPRQVVVRARAVAINPVDWIIQSAPFTYRWLRYPAVLGSDVAGEVVALGPGASRFALGDRVAGLAIGAERERDRAEEGAFRSSVVLDEDLAAPLPPDVPFERGAVLPLGLSTAASALFQTSGLGLRLPSAAPERSDERVLVWGAGTSVGMNAVQLAKAAGYDVVATASDRTADLVRALGVDRVLDRRDPAVVHDAVTALGAGRLAGAFAVGAGSTAPTLAIVRAAGGARRLVSASTPVALDGLRPGPAPALRALPTLMRMGGSIAATSARARLAGVGTSMVWGSSLKDTAVGPAIWRGFLPGALADGTYRPVPEPEIVGDGLEALQDALDRQRRGVTAAKLVVTL